MSETLLTNLELQVETLLGDRSQLRNENKLLRNKLSATGRERAELADRNKSAIKRMKQILSQLRNEAPWQQKSITS